MATGTAFGVGARTSLDIAGAYDDATSSSLRLGLPAGVHTLAVRVTDDSGARTHRDRPVLVARWPLAPRTGTGAPPRPGPRGGVTTLGRCAIRS